MRIRYLLSLAVVFLAPAGISFSQEANDPVYDKLKNMIVSEVRAECEAGSKISEDAGTFSLAPDGNVIVRFAGFECKWKYTNRVFCGARACQTREYKVSGSDVRLVREYLE